MEKHSDPDPTPPEPSRRERKKREAQQKIYQAAIELFLEQGFEETTVDQIAQRADVGKGTVFNYFPRKTLFLAALADDWMSHLLEKMGPVKRWKGSTREQLERVFLSLADLSVQNRALSRLSYFEHLRSIPEQRPWDERHVREFQAITRAVLRRGQVSGDVRPDLNPEHAATLIESTFFLTLVHWLRDGGSANALREEISAKLDIIIDGIASPSGPAGRSTKSARRKPARGRRG